VINEKEATLSVCATGPNAVDNHEAPSEVDVHSGGRERDPVEETSHKQQQQTLKGTAMLITIEDFIRYIRTKDGTPYPANHIEEPVKILDPRPLAAVMPYHFPLPSGECLAAIGNGDVVEVMAPDLKEAAPDLNEARARIHVESADAESIRGTVIWNSVIAAMDGFPDPGIIQVPKTHITEVDFATPNKHARSARVRPRRYLEFCVIDDDLMCRKDQKTLYLYRDRPFKAHKKSDYPDSGWRILSVNENVDITSASIKEILAKHNIRYTQLRDALLWGDSWIHLIDQPIGSAFLRTTATGLFSKVDKPPLGLIKPDFPFSLSGDDPLAPGK
jgi:hypothetical protein